MAVTEIVRDDEERTLTAISLLDAPPERVWALWEDPRLLERWWGPPEWPASFTRHDVAVPGGSSYHMTGPDGEEAHGWWEFREVDPPRRLVIDDGFADADGTRSDAIPPTVFEVLLDPEGEGTRLTVRTRFVSDEQLRQLLEMGMQEGLAEALGQIDGVLADS